MNTNIDGDGLVYGTAGSTIGLSDRHLTLFFNTVNIALNIGLF